jgi:formate-dependent nitrite reductase membrane component NrfD
LSPVIAWIGSLAIIAGFLILQIKLHQPASNWTTIMEMLSTAVEFWLIWVWNGLFG